MGLLPNIMGGRRVGQFKQRELCEQRCRKGTGWIWGKNSGAQRCWSLGEQFRGVGRITKVLAERLDFALQVRKATEGW